MYYFNDKRYEDYRGIVNILLDKVEEIEKTTQKLILKLNNIIRDLSDFEKKYVKNFQKEINSYINAVDFDIQIESNKYDKLDKVNVSQTLVYLNTSLDKIIGFHQMAGEFLDNIKIIRPLDIEIAKEYKRFFLFSLKLNKLQKEILNELAFSKENN